MKIFILLFSMLLFVGETKAVPTLHFEDEVNWKQVFDAGFRPKHLSPRVSCECRDQEIRLRFKDRRDEFFLESGRVAFYLGNNDALKMIWHQGREAIALDEGKKRVDEFRKIFEGFIFQEMSMPRLIDPSGLVDAGNDQNNIKARVGKWLVWYGFDNSYRKDKQLIPHFYIALSYPGMPEEPFKPLDYVVKPPVGYEWYSLDPKIDTPELGSAPAASSEKAASVAPPENVSESHKRPRPVETAEQDRNKVSWLWRIGLAAGAILIAFLLRRLFSRRSA